MKTILIVGASGTLGSEVVKLFHLEDFHVTAASRNSTPALDIEDSKSMTDFFQQEKLYDAVICVAGHGAWGKFSVMPEEKIIDGLKNKLLSQIYLTRNALPHLKRNGVIILTGGLLAHRPMLGTWNLSTANAALEGFVKAIQLELPEEKRIIIVHPPMLKETAEKMKIKSDGLPLASLVAETYFRLIASNEKGKAIYVDGFEP